MRNLLFCFIVVALGITLASCGEGSRSTGLTAHDSAATATTLTAARVGSANRSSKKKVGGAQAVYTPVDRDRDNDPEANPYDDRGNGRFYAESGPPEDTADAHAVASLVRRYYAAALTGDGVRACSMLPRALAAALPEDYAEPGGIAAAQGAESCGEVLGRLFASIHRALVRVVPGLRVLQVRVRGWDGIAVLHIAKVERQIAVEREGGVWKIGSLLDVPVG